MKKLNLLFIIGILITSIFVFKQNVFAENQPENSKITSSVYDIEREKENPNSAGENYDPFITEIELKTTINDFYSNLDNDSNLLHVYDLNGNEVTDLDSYVGTGFQVKLESNGHTYDTLNIIVLGDINGDGRCTINDLNIVKNVLLKKKKTLSDVEFLAADTNCDRRITISDLNSIHNYLLKKKSSFINKKASEN